MRPIKRFFRWVIKVVQYAKLLWNDEDWDYNFILRLLKYKLERTRKCIVKNDIVVAAPQIGQEIARAEELIERILKDDYYKEDVDLYFDKYGWMRFKRDLLTAEEDEQRRKEFAELSDNIHAAQEKDWQELWIDLMMAKMRGWWD